MKFNKNIVLLFICLFCLNGSVTAQKYVEKPFQKWSKDEAIKVLTTSPWAQIYQSTEGASRANQAQVGREQRQNANSGGSNPRSVARDFGPPPVVLRLH